MLETMGKPSKRFGMLVETNGIAPKDYHKFNDNLELENYFDLFFTYTRKF